VARHTLSCPWHPRLRPHGQPSVAAPVPTTHPVGCRYGVRPGVSVARFTCSPIVAAPDATDMPARGRSVRRGSARGVAVARHTLSCPWHPRLRPHGQPSVAAPIPTSHPVACRYGVRPGVSVARFTCSPVVVAPGATDMPAHGLPVRRGSTRGVAVARHTLSCPWHPRLRPHGQPSVAAPVPTSHPVACRYGVRPGVSVARHTLSCPWPPGLRPHGRPSVAAPVPRVVTARRCQASPTGAQVADRCPTPPAHGSRGSSTTQRGARGP